MFFFIFAKVQPGKDITKGELIENGKKIVFNTKSIMCLKYNVYEGEL